MGRGIALLTMLVFMHGTAWGENGHSVAAKAGLLGLGLEYGYSFNERLGLRLGWNGSKIGFDREESGIEYEFDLVWDSLSAAVDFHPMAGAFRITGGLLRNKNRLEAISRPNEPVNIGGRTYPPQLVGELDLDVGFNRSAPFVGVGWDWRRDRPLGISFDLGLLAQGSPRVSLTGRGPVAGDPRFEEDLAEEEAQLREDLRDFKYYPFATLGLVLRF
jgi:hypothetical protein